MIEQIAAIKASSALAGSTSSILSAAMRIVGISSNGSFSAKILANGILPFVFEILFLLQHSFKIMSWCISKNVGERTPPPDES